MGFRKPVFAIAVAALAGLLLVWGTDAAGVARERLQRHRNLGKAFYENPTGAAAAVEEFRKALELAPKSAVDRLNYGLALLRANRLEEGVAELSQAQRSDPKIPHTWFNLGIQFKKLGRYSEAIRQLREFARLVPDEPVSHYNLGLLYQLTDKPAEALNEFRLANRLNPLLVAPLFQIYNAYRLGDDEAQTERALAAFQEVKNRQKEADESEDMEWNYYSEIYDVPETLPASEERPAAVRFEDRPLAGKLDAATAGMAVLDIDGDGAPDLLAWSRNGLHAYRNGSSPMQLAGLAGIRDVISVAVGDYDNDGLADLCILTEAGAALYRNVKGDFAKSPVTLPAGRFVRAVWLDYDHDYDLDLILLGPKSALVRNQGTGGFADRTSDFPFQPGTPVDAAAMHTVSDDRTMDLVVSYAERAGTFYRDQLHGVYRAEPLATVAARGTASPVMADLTNRGAVERVEQAASFAGTILAAADFNGDGRVDLAAVDSGGTPHLLVNRTATRNRWLRVSLEGVKNLKLAHGAQVEVKAGAAYQKRLYEAPSVLIGLGGYREADTVRITWPNGMIQNQTQVAAGRSHAFKEAPRLSGSCPMVFTWNGREMQFLTDVLGVAPLGASSGDDGFFPLDHDEYVQIPPGALAARNGRYEVRITEELREVSFLDQTQLVAVDHPAGTEIFTNEKFKSPPFPEFRLFGVSRRIYPARATDDRGRDVLERVLRKDRRYPDGFRRDFAGVAELHALDLDFGPTAAPDNRAILALSGWVDWADGSTFMAAAQAPGGALALPYLQVKDPAGAWQTVIADMGMPAGKPKTIVVDLTGKFLSASREIRIVTNLCVYWDEIFLGESSAPPAVRLTSLDAAAAELGFRGFSRALIDPQRRQSEAFDYARVSPVSMWNPTPGLYTRYGDVRALLSSPDDRFVIMGSGDELQLRFDAAALLPLAAGWTCDFLLRVDGWSKDGDANTAHSGTVEPLPFHAMTGYPYRPGERFPDDTAHRSYRDAYNVRPALRLVRPLW